MEKEHLEPLLKSIDTKLGKILLILEGYAAKSTKSKIKKPARRRRTKLTKFVGGMPGCWLRLKFKLRADWDYYVKYDMPQRPKHKIPVRYKDNLIIDRRKPFRNGFTAFVFLNTIAFTYGLSVPRLKPPHPELTVPPPPLNLSMKCENLTMIIKWLDPVIASEVSQDQQTIISLYIRIGNYLNTTIIANLKCPTKQEYLITAVKLSERSLEKLEKVLKQKIVLTKDGKVPLKYFKNRTMIAQMETLVVADEQSAPLLSVGSNTAREIIS